MNKYHLYKQFLANNLENSLGLAIISNLGKTLATTETKAKIFKMVELKLKL